MYRKTLGQNQRNPGTGRVFLVIPYCMFHQVLCRKKSSAKVIDNAAFPLHSGPQEARTVKLLVLYKLYSRYHYVCRSCTMQARLGSLHIANDMPYTDNGCMHTQCPHGSRGGLLAAAVTPLSHHLQVPLKPMLVNWIGWQCWRQRRKPPYQGCARCFPLVENGLIRKAAGTVLVATTRGAFAKASRGCAEHTLLAIL